MPIPAFRSDGYLPEGLHKATEHEVRAVLGRGTSRRRTLMAHVFEWLQLSRAVGVRRLVLDGSFVTAKPEPQDVDAVCWLPDSFQTLYFRGDPEAVRLYTMLVTRRPAELFGVFHEEEWEDWISFFSQTRELDGRCKGLVEVML